MDLSDLARRNTISLEVKKDGLTQRQSGDWRAGPANSDSSLSGFSA
ncbi:hypothetical protein QIH91_20200 [Bradyrhizobium japonicum USDA 135]|nr:hypothetical protein QIH91_20200 [Bradyrhizobium japonicum USDA 135]